MTRLGPRQCNAPWARSLSIHDAGFGLVPIACRTYAGAPYTPWVPAGMPAIPREMLQCVLYLYKDKAAALSGRGFGGCGFLASVPATDGGQPHCYLVTNYHVAVRDGFCYARINTRYGVDVVEFDSSDFRFLVGKGDVCAAPINLTGDHLWTVIEDSHLLSRNQAGFVYIGDDVFMLGRFIDHDGGPTNHPAARFGNVSVLETFIPNMPNSDAGCTYYCLDMHSRAGHSGSPTWVYRLPGHEFVSSLLNQEVDREVAGQKMYGLLAIHSAQFLEEDDPKRAVGYSGMTIALPAWRILELMDHPQLKEIRVRVEALRKGAGGPRISMESAVPEEDRNARFDATVKAMLKSPPSSQKKRSKGGAN